MKKKNKEIKEEIFRVSEGYCFGESLLLSSCPQKSLEAIAFEDSYLFYLEKEDFDLILAVI